MKNICLALLIPLIFITLPAPVAAKVITSESLVSVAENEVIEDDLFIAGESVIIEGTVNGDIYAAGGAVNISGTVTGDVIVGGGTITISDANIGDDLRTAGGNITINNTQIGDSATVAGGNITISGDTSTQGTLTFAGGNILIDSQIGRNLYGGGGLVTLNSSVGKEVMIGGGKLTIGPNAQIQGDLTYTSDEQLSLDPSALVSGEIINKPPRVDYKELDTQIETSKDQLVTGFTLWSLFSSIVIGSILVALFPKTWNKMSKSLHKKPWSNIGYGLVICLLIIPFFIFSLVTVIGIPLAFLSLGLFIQGLFLSKLVVAPALGSHIYSLLVRQPKNRYIAMITGLVMLAIFSRVPVLNAFTTIFTALAGLGVLFTHFLQIVKSERK